MKITIDRFTSNSDATLSLVLVNGAFECFGLEDERREFKVARETRIPAGLYSVDLRDEGQMTKRYAKRFPLLHRGMLHILDVPDFDWIYFHIGNREDHTDGCILVGQTANAEGQLTIGKSAYAYERFYRKVLPAALADDLVVDIHDKDRN